MNLLWEIHELSMNTLHAALKGQGRVYKQPSDHCFSWWEDSRQFTTASSCRRMIQTVGGPYKESTASQDPIFAHLACEAKCLFKEEIILHSYL